MHGCAVVDTRLRSYDIQCMGEASTDHSSSESENRVDSMEKKVALKMTAPEIIACIPHRETMTSASRGTEATANATVAAASTTKAAAVAHQAAAAAHDDAGKHDVVVVISEDEGPPQASTKRRVGVQRPKCCKAACDAAQPSPPKGTKSRQSRNQGHNRKRKQTPAAAESNEDKKLKNVMEQPKGPVQVASQSHEAAAVTDRNPQEGGGGGGNGHSAILMRPKPKWKAKPSKYTCECSGGVQVYHRTVLDTELRGGLHPASEVYYCKECDKATIWAQDGRHIVTVYGDVPLKLAMKGIPVRPKPPPSVAQRQATTKASSHNGRPPQP